MFARQGGPVFPWHSNNLAEAYRVKLVKFLVTELRFQGSSSFIFPFVCYIMLAYAKSPFAYLIVAKAAQLDACAVAASLAAHFKPCRHHTPLASMWWGPFSNLFFHVGGVHFILILFMLCFLCVDRAILCLRVSPLFLFLTPRSFPLLGTRDPATTNPKQFFSAIMEHLLLWKFLLQVTSGPSNQFSLSQPARPHRFRPTNLNWDYP